MVASRCVFNAFWISFQPSWADLEQAANEHWHRTMDTVSGLRIAKHVNSKRFIDTLPTEMFFDLV